MNTFLPCSYRVSTFQRFALLSLPLRFGSVSPLMYNLSVSSLGNLGSGFLCPVPLPSIRFERLTAVRHCVLQLTPRGSSQLDRPKHLFSGPSLLHRVTSNVALARLAIRSNPLLASP